MPTAATQDAVAALLRSPGRWAVVGLSTNNARAAYGVAAYLQEIGHTIIPVHPSAPTVHGETGYATLAAIPWQIDVVDVFVASHHAGAVIDEAIEVGARAVWLQLGVHDADAERRAATAGLVVVTDLCPRIEGPRHGIARPRAAGSQPPQP